MRVYMYVCLQVFVRVCIHMQIYVCILYIYIYIYIYDEGMAFVFQIGEQINTFDLGICPVAHKIS